MALARNDAPDIFDRDERLAPLRVHLGMEHLGAFVGGVSTWTACRDVASPATSTGTTSGLADVFIAANTIDDLDLDGLAQRLRSIGVTDVEGDSPPKGDGWFGFALVVAELRGHVDVAAITLEQYRQAAELLRFVAEWAVETATEQGETVVDPPRHIPRPSADEWCPRCPPAPHQSTVRTLQAVGT